MQTAVRSCRSIHGADPTVPKTSYQTYPWFLIEFDESYNQQLSPYALHWLPFAAKAIDRKSGGALRIEGRKLEAFISALANQRGSDGNIFSSRARSSNIGSNYCCITSDPTLSHFEGLLKCLSNRELYKWEVVTLNLALPLVCAPIPPSIRYFKHHFISADTAFSAFVNPPQSILLCMTSPLSTWNRITSI